MAHNMWVAGGRPSSGMLFETKKSAKYRCKLTIRDAANTFESQFDDELLAGYLRKDFNSFWKVWKNKVQTKRPNISFGDLDDIAVAKKLQLLSQLIKRKITRY